jgi:Mg2+ and Co2+ transporter CorA
MPWRTFQFLTMIAAFLLSATLLSGKFGVIENVPLRYIAVLQGVAIGAMLTSALVKLGWIKL